MREKMIQQYIDKMTIDNVYEFANKNGVSLETNEAKVIFHYVKNDWQTILYGNPNDILDKVKAEVSPNTYKKVVDIFNYYRNKI